MSLPKRQFSSGSRLPPDPIDKYLMRHCFYRKHTARDASSLFRVISEQVFDTQIYHEFVRKMCTDWMYRNKGKVEEVSKIVSKNKK